MIVLHLPLETQSVIDVFGPIIWLKLLLKFSKFRLFMLQKAADTISVNCREG